MSHLNGKSVDSSRHGWDEIETSINEALDHQPKRDLLDLLGQTVNEGRRDRRALDRIVSRYGISDASQIRERIEFGTAEACREILS